MKAAISLFFLFFFVHLFCIAQESISVKGTVLDKSSNKIIPYAHISIINSSKGTISNLNGEFEFHLENKNFEDTIVISFIGYKSYTQIIKVIVEEEIEKFYLEIVSTEMEGVEVVESKITAQDVIETAISKIPDNYPSSSYLMKGFFRDSKSITFFQEEEQSENLLLEAAVNIHDPGYFHSGKKKLEDTYIKEIRRNELPESRKGDKGWNYYNSLFASLLANNYVKYPGAKDPTIKEPLLSLPNQYQFSFDWKASNDDQTVIIATHPNHNLIYKIFIDNENYAFSKIDLTKSKDQNYGNGQYRLIEINDSQQFQKWNDKWYLAYKRQQWEVEKLEPVTNVVLQKEQYFIELLINEVLITQSPANDQDLGIHMDRKKPLEFQIRPYNENFWKNYNIIKDQKSFNFQKTESQRFFTKSTREDVEEVNQQNTVDFPEQVDDLFQWTFNREDSLLGSLNKKRNCYDISYYQLKIDADPVSETLKGSVLIYFEVIDTTTQIQVDLDKHLSILSIRQGSENLSFSREYNSIFINFSNKLFPGTNQNIIIEYFGQPLKPIQQIPQYGAFVWSNDQKGNPWFQTICQGSGANGWWPNKDHLSDKADSASLYLTIPSKLTAVASGRLLSKTADRNEKTTYTWKVNYPILNYNISFNVGDYVEDTNSYINNKDTLELVFYKLAAGKLNSEKILKTVNSMLKVYEDCFGLYPFPKDGFKLVQSILPMEHQSCISIGRDYNEDILLHESAHEWWGNSVSCTDYADLWIHEAFATYAVGLFKEFDQSPSIALDYFDFLGQNVKNEMPILGVPGVKHIHYDITDMYSKGALMLNTLRSVINNDQTWFDILRGIQEKYQYKSINTEELILYFNSKTGIDYSGFFNQYLRYTSLPELEVVFLKHQTTSTIKYKWNTDVSDFNIPIKVKIGNGEYQILHPGNEWKNKIVQDNGNNEVEVEGGYFVNLNIKTEN